MAKKSPKNPDTSEHQYGRDDGHRMQVVDFGKQDRHQHVAVEMLQDDIGDGNVKSCATLAT